MLCSLARADAAPLLRDDGDGEFVPFFTPYRYMVKERIADFLKDLKKNYDGKHVAIVAHQAPQLALDVLLKGMSWEEAFANDWRKQKAWKPGWEYEA